MPRRFAPLAARARDLRIRRGLTQAQLAELATVDRTTIWALEHAAHALHSSTLRSIERALGVKDGYLVKLRDRDLTSANKRKRKRRAAA